MSDAVQTPERFDVESLEWADGTLKLSGRWFGVRGKRFVRPTLVADDGGRLLASLDDKPWQAEDGDEWRASFPCEQPPAPGTEFTFTVGGGTEIQLRFPGGDDGRFPRSELSEADEARGQLASAQARLDLMRSEIASAEARLDAAREERRVLAIARERAEADLRRVSRERDAALQERDAAKEERNQMRRERDVAHKERNAAEKVRDSAVKRRDAMERERDKYGEGLTHAREELSDERAAFKQDRKRRDNELKELRKALNAAHEQIAAAPPPSPAAPDRPAEPPPQPMREWRAPWRHTQTESDTRLQRIIAGVALFLVVVLLLILL